MKENTLKQKISVILRSVTLWLFMLTSTFPFLWMIGASLKREPDVFQTPFALFPDYVYLENFKTVWNGKYNYPQMFLNSVIVTGISVVVALFLCCIAGYGFGRLKFPGRDKIFVLYLATMMIPTQLLMVPKYLMFREMGIYNTHLALILPAFFTIYGVFLMRQAMQQIPESISEAARIDGANEWQICFRLIVPLCKPAIITLIILLFTWHWNDYDNALLFLQDKELYTLPLGLTYFMDETGMRYSLIMAAGVITIIPIFIVFLVAQKYFIGGLTSGAVKE